MNREQEITHSIQAVNPNLDKLKKFFSHGFDKKEMYKPYLPHRKPMMVSTEPVYMIDLSGYKAYYTKKVVHKSFSTIILKAMLE